MDSPELLGTLGGPGASRRWRFHPRTSVRLAGDERKFHHGIRAALRVAAGLGCAFRARWESGSHGGASIEPASRASDAWFRHVLLPTYGLGQWSVAPDAPARARSLRRFGLLRGPTALPLPFSVDRPPWSDTVLEGLRAAPPGVHVIWEAEPGRPDRAGPAVEFLPFARAAPPPARALPPSAVERAVRDGVEERLRSILWSVRLELAGVDDAGAVDRVGDLVSAATRLEGGNGLRFVRPILGRSRRPPGLLFSEPELIGLWPSPWAAVAVPRSPERSVAGLWVGRQPDGSPWRLPIEPREGRHLLILGETGMGKSSALVRLLRAAVRYGGAVLLDPIGDTGRALMAELPEGMLDRVRWVSPTASPLGVNALASIAERATTGGPRDRAVHEIVSALRRVRLHRYSEGGFWGPRIEETLTQCLQIAAARPGGTLLDAYALLQEGSAPDGESAHGGRGAEALRELVRRHPEEVAGSRRVLGEIAGNEVLRRMLCAREPELHLPDLIGPGRIAIVTGDAPAVGEPTARHLLAVYLALLWSELLGRGRTEKVFLALEELQWYAHEGVLELLRLGRRGNIHLWCTTQSLHALDEAVREALLTNSADLLLFRGDPEEAREFARWSPELAVDRLLALPRGHAAGLIGKGSAVGWITLPPPRGIIWTSERADRVRHARPLEAAIPDRSPTDRGAIAAVGSLSDLPVPDIPLDDPITFLRARARRATGARFRVRLDELRARTVGGTDPLRQLGSDLRSRGMLLRSIAASSGTVWELRSDGWGDVEAGEPAVPPGPPPTDIGRAREGKGPLSRPT